MAEYEREAMAKIRYHHALWLACGRDREKVRAFLAQADAEHDYRPAPKLDAATAELRKAEEELAFAQRANVHHRIPERVVAAMLRVEAARAAIDASGVAPTPAPERYSWGPDSMEPDHDGAWVRFDATTAELLRSAVKRNVGVNLPEGERHG